MLSIRLLSILLLVSPTLHAQLSLTIPFAASATAEGDSGCAVGGFDTAGRTQILIDDATMGPSLVGRSLVALSFRRDGDFSGALRGGQARLVVVVSTSPRSSLHASRQMDENLDPDPLERVIVFQGDVTLPASAAPNGRAVGWDDPQDVVEIGFESPFPYVGGHLCVDITGTPVAGAEPGYWPVDGVVDASRGSKVAVGRHCGFIAGLHRHVPASVDPETLVPGSTAVFWSRGPASAGAGLLIGTPFPSFDLSLVGIGDAGCMLEVDPFVTLVATFDRGVSPRGAATACFELQVPADSAALALGFRAQFAAVEGTRVLTSNAVDVAIASTFPSLGMAIVHGSASTGFGVVRTSRAPVMRFAAE